MTTTITTIRHADHVEIIVPARHRVETVRYIRVVEAGEIHYLRFAADETADYDAQLAYLSRKATKLAAIGKTLSFTTGVETSYRPVALDDVTAEHLAEIHEYYGESEINYSITWNVAA